LLFSAEGGPEAVHPAQRRRSRLEIELAGLGQVGLAKVEIVGGKEIPRLLTDRTGEDRRVDQGEATIVEEVADGLDQLMAHPCDGHLAAAAEPEMSMFEEESRPMFLGGDGKVGTGAEDLDGAHAELDAAG
jgi:hypothetical protein